MVSSSELSSSKSFAATFEDDEFTRLNLYLCEGVNVFTDVVDVADGVERNGSKGTEFDIFKGVVVFTNSCSCCTGESEVLVMDELREPGD